MYKRRAIIFATVFTVSGLGIVFVANAVGNGNHICTNCHSQDGDLCDSRECSSNEVCSGDEGTLSNGHLWVVATCERKNSLLAGG